MNIRSDDQPTLINTATGRHDRVRERGSIALPHTSHMSISTTGPESGGLSLQRLSLDSAVSPLLRKPTTPFDRTERKRAHTSALYYSECVLKGITPVVADSAAEDAQGIYNKWWVKSTAAGEIEAPAHTQTRSTFQTSSQQPELQINDVSHVKKWRKTMHDRPLDRELDDASVASANAVSIATAGGNASQRNNEEDETTLKHIEHVSIPEISTVSTTDVQTVKRRLIHELKVSGGSVETPEFAKCLEFLEVYYQSKNLDGRISSSSYGGTWLTLSKPTYNECKGRNEKGEYLYSLGRMSFDMYKPTNLVCSIQAVFNSVRPVDPKNPDRPLHVPRRLMKEIQRGQVTLQTYDIVVAFTIEAGQTRRGEKKDASAGEYVVPRRIRGIINNHGYLVPDPEIPNRFSIWFSGGSLEVQDEPRDLEEWKIIFDTACVPNRDLREYANILAAKLLLGAHLPETVEEDGTMSFVLKRPIGGHGSAYCDIIYMDENLRIMRGHHGSVYVCTRVANPNAILEADP